MDALAKKRDARLREWRAETAAYVPKRVAEVIELADADALDILGGREVEQEVLELLDEPSPR